MHFRTELSKMLTLVCVVLVCVANIEAGILPLTWLGPNNNNNNNGNDKTALANKFGYIEYKPNGTLVLRSTLENGTDAHNLRLLRSILGAIRLAAPFIGDGGGIAEDGTYGADSTAPKLNIKIYGDGVEHKFPPFLENVIQRIQSYFSVYKYTDTSRPFRTEAEVAAAAAAVAAAATSAAQANSVSSTAAVEGSGFGYGVSLQPTDSLVDAAIENEFIAIGRNEDGFIDVGED